MLTLFNIVSRIAGHKVESVSGGIKGNNATLYIYIYIYAASSKPFLDVCDSWIRDVVDLEPYVYMHVT